MSSDVEQDIGREEGRGDQAPAAAPVRAPGVRAGQILVFAWAVSIGIHALLFWMMLAFPWSTVRNRGPQDTSVAHTELLDGMDQARTTVERRVPSFVPETTVPAELRYAPRPSNASAAIAAAAPLGGEGPGSGDDAGSGGLGRGSNLRIIGLGGGGGDLGKYGLDVGSMDPGPQFFGLGSRVRGAKRIVYVVDRSGSMIETFDALRAELVRSVDRLRRSQRFHVILFNEGPPQENTPKKLVNASADQKEGLSDFLQRVEPQGNTDPIPAMRRAFELSPDLIYFLTDGEFDPRLVEELRKRNSQKKVRICTIAYVSQTGSALLEQIARENSGEYRFVSENDL